MTRRLRLAGHVLCCLVAAGSLFLWLLADFGSHGWLLACVLAGMTLHDRLENDRLQADLERHRLTILSIYGRPLCAAGSIRDVEAAVERFLREHMPVGVDFEVKVSRLEPGRVRVEVRR